MYRRWLLKGFTLINGWLASAVRDRPARPVARIQLLGRHPDQLPVGLNQRPRRAQVLGLPDLAHPTLFPVAPTSSCQVASAASAAWQKVPRSKRGSTFPPRAPSHT